MSVGSCRIKVSLKTGLFYNSLYNILIDNYMQYTKSNNKHNVTQEDDEIEKLKILIDK